MSDNADDLPPLPGPRIENLEPLAARPDDEIDFSYIPELTEEQFRDAIRGRFYRPVER